MLHQYKGHMYIPDLSKLVKKVIYEVKLENLNQTSPENPTRVLRPEKDIYFCR